MSEGKRPGMVRDALGPDVTSDAREAWLADAADGFRSNGVVILRNAIPRPRIAAVLEALKARQMSGDEGDDRPFQPAPLRPRIAVPLDGPFADPAIFAPPSALALARRLLGDEMIVGELGIVISRPGDGPHETRRAAIPLFGGLDVESDVPSAALAMLAPLGDVAPGAGFPEYWVESHRTRDGAADTAVPPFQPAFEAGSVVMCDWRILYRAGLNTSGATQLALYVSFQRKWLLSLSGSEYKPGLRVPAATLKRLPQAYHPLISWALHQNKTDDVSEFLHLWMGRVLKGLRAATGG
jgi:hypothetical protein